MVTTHKSYTHIYLKIVQSYPVLRYTYAEEPVGTVDGTMNNSETARNLDPDDTYKTGEEVDHGNHSIKYHFNRRGPPGGKRWRRIQEVRL